MVSEAKRTAVRRHEAVRLSLLALGWLLLVAAPIVGLLPGPGGIFVAAGGLILLLKNSHWAKRQYVLAKRRWPRIGHWCDKGLRRPSFHRRRARKEAKATAE
jgi:hypothetical protein